MVSEQRLSKARVVAAERCRPVGEGPRRYCIFLSACDGGRRAVVVHSAADDFGTAWDGCAQALQKSANAGRLIGRWLRIDWITAIEGVDRSELERRLKGTKRSYFRRGISFDQTLAYAATEQELNAHAVLYGGPKVEHAILNERNLAVYFRSRFGVEPPAPIERLMLFDTEGVMLDGDVVHDITGRDLETGRRDVERMTPDVVLHLIREGSEYLARQVDATGRFEYGYFPCFDRRIGTYNNLRHASSTYAMAEAWEVTQSEPLLRAIERSLNFLTSNALIRRRGTGREMAYLAEPGGVAKLGGNAVLILALTKHAEVTGNTAYLDQAESLARGIAALRRSDGGFDHVLDLASFKVKADDRVIYYDGEAVFALARLFGATGNPEWLAIAESAFTHFIASDYWRYHDHWLAYCANELTKHNPDPSYFRFAVDNLTGYLDFVSNRITTYPTLLELMMASHSVLTRMGAHRGVLAASERIDQDRFYLSMEKRARHLLNGFFWPELAMYFKNPRRISGSFFIRHHAFRVRIDDVEHYISGLVAYHNYLTQGSPRY